MNVDLISQGYNEIQKSDTEIEKELADQTKKKIISRHAENNRIRDLMSKGYKDVPERAEIPKQTDPDKMSPYQLLSHGHEQLEKKQTEEEKKTTKTIDFFNEEENN